MALNRIQDYDSTLIEDIQKLKEYVEKAEELGKEYMRVYGASEKMIEEVSSKARDEDRPISTDGSGAIVYELLEFLRVMVKVYSNFAFRLRMGDYFVTRLGTQVRVVTEDDEFIFNTRTLDDDERKKYLNHWNATQQLNYVGKNANVYWYYPTEELVKFVAEMMTKYSKETIVSKSDYHDEKLSILWNQEWENTKEELRKNKERQAG